VSLIPSVAAFAQPPYKAVLTHGFVVDEEGRKMSKSLGNVVSPQEILKTYGADILRLWTCFSDYHQDVKISKKIISQLVDSYRKIRNTFRFLLGNLYDFSPEKSVSYNGLLELDQWALACLYRLSVQIENYYREYEFHRIFQSIYKFCIVELSNIYFDILKDRLYTWGKNSLGRRSAQTVLYYLLQFFTRAMAPILSFTCEEAFLEAKKLGFERSDSVFLDRWVQLPAEFNNEVVIKKYQYLLFSLREDVNKALEEKRQEGVIGSSLEAEVHLYLPSEEVKELKKIKTNLEWIFIVSCVKLFDFPDDTLKGMGLVRGKIVVRKAEGKKCPRCWNYTDTIGRDTHYPDICQRCVEALKGGSDNGSENKGKGTKKVSPDK